MEALDGSCVGWGGVRNEEICILAPQDLLVLFVVEPFDSLGQTRVFFEDLHEFMVSFVLLNINYYICQRLPVATRGCIGTSTSSGAIKESDVVASE